MAIDPLTGQEVPGSEYGGPLRGLWDSIFGGGQQQQPPSGPEYGPIYQPQVSADSGESEDDRVFSENQRRKDAADVATAEAIAKIKQREAEAEDDPELKKIKMEQARLALEMARAQLAKIQSSVDRDPKELAQFQNDLEVARQQAQNQFQAGQSERQRQFEGEQAQASRDFTAQQNDLSRGVSLRGQEIDRLKAQDDWVLGILRQQVAEGTLSLQKATNQFNAYIERARLPSQIMESVSRAIEPFSAVRPPKGWVAPGNEPGGAMDTLSRAAGITNYKAPDEHAMTKGVDLFKLAKKAGADFKQTKVPDPGELFGSVPIPQTNFGSYQSALVGFPAANLGPGGAGGLSLSPPAPPPSGPVGSVTPQPDWQMSDEQIARLNSLLDAEGGQ